MEAKKPSKDEIIARIASAKEILEQCAVCLDGDHECGIEISACRAAMAALDIALVKRNPPERWEISDPVEEEIE